MIFVKDIEKFEYDNFVKKHEKSHFLQSYAWGEFVRESRGLIPHYVGVKNENKKLIAATMLLEKKLPFGYSYFYAPRGFVVDFWNKELLSFFTNEIKKYIKEKKAIFLKIDPDIIWSKKDNNDNEIELDKDPNIVFNNLKELNFRHLGFTKNFETMQPRYTFRINMDRPFEEIENNFSKTTKQKKKKAISLNTKVREASYDEIDIFNNLMTITENRKDFVSHDLEYYKKLFEIYNKNNRFTIFLVIINLDEIIKKYEDEIVSYEKELNSFPNENLSKSQNTRKKEIEKELPSHRQILEKYIESRNEYGSEIVLNAHAIIEYGTKAWVLYAGNHNILTSTYSNYKTYYEHMKYCYKNGIKLYDQFGTIGDLSNNNPRLGLHEFKKKFGGNYIEFIGEFDLILNKPLYLIFTKIVPLYRKIIRNISKRKKRDK